MPVSPLHHLAATLLAGTAPVADAAPPSSSDIVVTANRTPRAVSQVGESVTVINQEEIERRQSSTVADLLRTVPGVAVVRNGGGGTVTSVSIRGAESDQTVVLIDGVKLNDPSTPGGGFNFGNLLTGNIARIEVVRGSQSVIWGSQAIGGVVNLITRAPGDDLRVNARAEAGSFGTWQAVANVSGRVGPVSGSFGAGYLATDGISAFSGGIERDGYENVGANGRVTVQVGPAVSIDLRGFYSNGETEIDGFPAPLFAFADTLEVGTTEEFVGYAGLNAVFADGRFRNRLAFTYTNTDRSNVDRTGRLPVTTFEGRGRNERFEYQGVYAPGDWLEAVFGAESEASSLLTSSFGAPASTAEAQLDSLYAQLSFAPLTGLRLTGGLRHDEHDYFGGETTAAASMVYTPNGGATTVRASYGEGFKAPTLFQLRSDFGNPALEPERSQSFDIGVAQRLIEGRLEVGATLFRRDTNDQIDFVSCFGNTAPFCAGRPFGTYDNIRRTRGEGVELTLAAVPLDGLTVQAQYSYVDAVNRDTGRALARRPARSASLIADHRWRSRLETGITVAYVGDSFDDAGNSRRLEEYLLVDLRAALPLTPSLALYARVENLFDESYETVFQYGTLGRAAYAGIRLRM